MTLQEHIDSIFTDKEIRRILLTYLHNNPSNELHKLLYLTGSKVIRVEFYMNVSAGLMPSVRRFYTDGQVFDGPLYGYILSLGEQPNKLEGVIARLRYLAYEELMDYLS